MKLQVLVFGPAAVALGASACEVTVHEGATVRDVLRALGEQVPALASWAPLARVARNHAFAAPGETVEPGDELALLVAMSGG
ncbi:MAG: MoaD/ThiS family protein [Polyangiaceae bacterium]|nr:MoaD/ThiS family protein [Polyangiaceae bacterium]